jgi:hypothetical protein
MTIPIESPSPPATVGTQPRNADEVNGLVGLHLRAVCGSKIQIGQDHDWLATVDLKAAPYYFSDTQETLIKSAIADLDTALDAVNMTFISQLVGM